MSLEGNGWIDKLVERLGGWDGDWMLFFIRGEIIGALAIGALGWYLGYLIERRHLARLERRETILQDIAVTQSSAVPPGLDAADSALLVASVVLSRGTFRMILVTIRKLFGGRITGYALLLERARREALVRLKEAARERGATTVINLRLETARISGSGKAVVEVMAYGTALKVHEL